MTRIKSTNMTIADCAITLSEGNPGAIDVMMQMVKHGEAIDPQAFMGGAGAMLFLDNLGIYGPRIWQLYKDVCGQDIGKTLALLRAVQLGMVYGHQLDEAIDNMGNGIDVDLMVHEVRARLSEFNHKARAK